MNSKDLRLVGYACILYVALSIPILILSVYTSAIGQAALSNIIQIANLILFVYITLSLKALLTEFEFEDVNGLLNLTIGINVFGVVFGMIAPDSGVMAFLAIAMLVVLGVLMLIIGIKLQKCQNQLHGLLKTFSLSMMATGICLASVVLLPLAMLAWMVMGIVQGMIFLKEADSRNKIFS